ncbi:MAG: hypothetical protein AAFP77_30300 [Bacteroidota bacterium]
MESIKLQERIATGLYVVAIILLLINIYQKGADIENRFVEIGGWLFFLVASILMAFVAKEKKKLKQMNEENE